MKNIFFKILSKGLLTLNYTDDVEYISFKDKYTYFKDGKPFSKVPEYIITYNDKELFTSNTVFILNSHNLNCLLCKINNFSNNRNTINYN